MRGVLVGLGGGQEGGGERIGLVDFSEVMLVPNGTFFVIV